MKNPLMKLTGARDPQSLVQSLRHDQSREMQLRRAVVAVSLVGIAAMGVVSLLQTGIVEDLPDPQTETPNFNTKKVNTSDAAYSWGMPDAPLTVAMHGAMIALASAGPADRWERRPWLPIAAAVLALPQAGIAAQYLFYQMPKVDKAWCPWCIADALVQFTVLGLVIPEARKAVETMRNSDDADGLGSQA